MIEIVVMVLQTWPVLVLNENPRGAIISRENSNTLELHSQFLKETRKCT